MGATPRRRRPSGSLGSLKSRLWASIEYLADVIDDESQSHEDRRASCNSLTQAAMAYSRLIEQHEMLQQLDELRNLAQGNGHLS
jgi:hypothetical protein